LNGFALARQLGALGIDEVLGEPAGAEQQRVMRLSGDRSAASAGSRGSRGKDSYLSLPCAAHKVADL
jgi:hypothetical protein